MSALELEEVKEKQEILTPSFTYIKQSKNFPGKKAQGTP